MTAPVFAIRSYGGNAQPAYLSQGIGADDLSFTLVPAPGASLAGWAEPSGMPLGTSGLFQVELDWGLPTAEKVRCSAIDLTSGAVTVATASGWNGRGDDQSPPQAHNSQAVNGGLCRPCFSATEAREANEAVAYLLGTAGGTPSSGQILTWGGSAPLWGSTGGLTGNPCGTMHATSQTIVASGGSTSTKIVNMAPLSGSLKGVTFGSNGLTVPVTGIYKISWMLKWQASSGGVTDAGNYQSFIKSTGTQILQVGQYSEAGGVPSVGASVDYPLSAGAVITLEGYQDSTFSEGSAFTNYGTTIGLATWVSVALVSE